MVSDSWPAACDFPVILGQQARRLFKGFGEFTAVFIADAVGDVQDAVIRPGELAHGFGHTRSSDDGEPAGTAGRPILEVLKKQGLTNTAIVVTRYFGGIKLGASGLIRAYSHAAALALEAADIAVYTPFTILTATVAYPLVSTMERFVPDHGGTITGRDFAADVTFTMEVPQSDSDAFAASLTDTTSGRVTCRKTGTIVKPVVSG